MKRLAIASAIAALALVTLSSTAAPPGASEIQSSAQQYGCQWIFVNGTWYCIPF